MASGYKKTHEEFVEEFNKINPNYEVIGQFIRVKDKIKIKCRLCGKERDVEAKYSINNQLRCSCQPFKKMAYNKSSLSHEEFIERFNAYNLKSDTIEIIGTYVNNSTPITCKCKICGGEWDTKPASLSRKDKPYGCPICRGLKVVKGINDVATVRPDLVKYFVNIEDAYNYTIGSGKSVEVICPLCGTKKISTPNRLDKQGFGCTVCSDYISYPNKFLKAFLEQLDGLDFFKMECSPEWIRPYRLDSYFLYQGKYYVVEMDGALGHGKKDFVTGGVDKDGIIRDKIKEEIIYKQGIKLIRIDCCKSDRTYIMNNILKSELNDIFNLSHIDWLKCDEYASKNIIYEICEAYESLPFYKQTPLDVSYILNMDISSIRTYLSRGYDLGLCSYTPEKSKKIGNLKLQQSSRKRYAKPILVSYMDNTVFKAYETQYECLDDMNNIYPDKNFNLNGIISNCTGKVKSHRGFIFSYI